MFRSHITRPVRWSLPLAVLGVVGAGLWFVRPLEIDIDGEAVNCREVAIAGFAEDPCADPARERLITTGLILLVTCLPFVLVVLRGFLWAADTIAELSEDVRRLREDREKERG